MESAPAIIGSGSGSGHDPDTTTAPATPKTAPPVATGLAIRTDHLTKTFGSRTAAAIAIGLTYLLVAENLLAAVWSGCDQWLPGQLLYALSKGGTSTVSYARALVLVGLYLVVAVGVAAALFRRRDVAA
jgi:hypothetical protein